MYPSIQRPEPSVQLILSNFKLIPLHMIPAVTSIVITNIAAWVLFLSLPVLFVNSQSGNNDILSILSSPYTWLFFITYIFS